MLQLRSVGYCHATSSIVCEYMSPRLQCVRVQVPSTLNRKGPGCPPAHPLPLLPGATNSRGCRIRRSPHPGPAWPARCVRRLPWRRLAGWLAQHLPPHHYSVPLPHRRARVLEHVPHVQSIGPGSMAAKPLLSPGARARVCVGCQRRAQLGGRGLGCGWWQAA